MRAQLCSSGMMGELRNGIAGQVQGELQGLVMGAGALVVNAMAADWKAQRLAELEGMPNRTAAEQMELVELQAEDWKRLEAKAIAAEKGEGDPLTIDELSRLNGYEISAMLDEID